VLRTRDLRTLVRKARAFLAQFEPARQTRLSYSGDVRFAMRSHVTKILHPVQHNRGCGELINANPQEAPAVNLVSSHWDVAVSISADIVDW